MDFLQPVQIGLAQYLIEYHASLAADTPSLEEYREREVKKAIVWAPGRLVDQVESMMVEWRKNDNTGKPGLSSMLPVIFVGFAKDFTPVLPEFSVAVGSAMDVSFPDDPLQRAYKARSSANEYRAQIVIAAAEVRTAHSLAMQFNLFANGPRGRRFTHVHEFAGLQHEFPAVLEQIDFGAVNTAVDQKNLTLLVGDLTIRATVPIFDAPRAGQPNDGKAAPAGYPVITQVDTASNAGATSTTSLDENGDIVTVRDE